MQENSHITFDIKIALKELKNVILKVRLNIGFVNLKLGALLNLFTLYEHRVIRLYDLYDHKFFIRSCDWTYLCYDENHYKEYNHCT